MHLPVDAEQAAVGVDHGRRVAIHARGLPFEERNDDYDLEFPGQGLHRIGGRTGNGFGEVEPLAMLRFAEVRRVEELFQADDLGAA